ncbi:MAG: S41 family peptidase [Terriglobales bacterium]
MKRILDCLAAAAVLGGLAFSQAVSQAEMTQPALSPDGQQIAFASNGAIWTVPARGGVARILIASAATESRPLYSPDGKWLAFESTRTGGGDIYLFNLTTSELRRLTWDDGADRLDCWSPDSQWVYFSSSSHNAGGMNDIDRVRITGGTPLPVSSQRYVDQYDAAAAPDGSLAVVTRGEMGLSQWWRDGHAHIDNTQIWRVVPAAVDGAKTGYQMLLPTDQAKNIWPMWGPEGRTLYFMSDRSGAENLWELPSVGAQPRALTHFTDGRLLWPALAADGSAIVFARDFRVWKLDLRHHRVADVPITMVGVPHLPSIVPTTITTATDPAVSPDGKKLAYTAHGEVFVDMAENGGPALRLTHTGKLQFGLQWAPDSEHLAYVSDRDGSDHIYQYDFLTDQEKQLTAGSGEEFHIHYAPDGKTLAFERGTTQIVTLDLATGQDKVLATGYFDSLPPLNNSGIMAWSPDSQYLAFLNHADGIFPEAYVVAASGGAPREVSFVPNSFAGSLAWSPDGRFLLYQTSQRTEPSQIARVDLTPVLPLFRENLFQDLFQKEKHPVGRAAAHADTPAATPTVDYEEIAERVQLLPMLNARSPRISPDGKWLAYIGSEGPTSNIYVVPLDRKTLMTGPGGPGGRAAAPKQLTSTNGRKADLQFTADSKILYYLDGNHIHRVAVTGGSAKTVNVSAELDVDFGREKEEMFSQVWRYLRDDYQVADMNGVNWVGVQTEFAPEVAAATNPDALRWLLTEMIGRLNSSHSGIYPPRGGARPSTGHIGLLFDRVGYERLGKLCVSEVIARSPAALAGVKVGDCLTQVDGTTVTGSTNLDELLHDTIGKKLTVTLTAASGASRTVAMKPLNASQGKQLIYQAWVAHNRALVAKLSGGRLGYVHMVDMETGSLNKLFMDLNSAEYGKEGVVVDVRNNNGGFVNAYALDMLTRQPYLTMIPRGFPKKPARVALGQRALEKPTILLVNQNTLSDGEDFTEGYEAMHLGQVVGLPTAGWIIYTSAGQLIDGSTVRLPSTHILDAQGKPMELHPRPVDITVHNPLGSWQDGTDPQLAAAVKALLAKVGGPPRHVAEGGNN